MPPVAGTAAAHAGEGRPGVIASELADTFTARELAEKLESAEHRATRAQRKLEVGFTALREIAAGHWSTDGCRTRTRKAMEEMRR